MWREADRRKYRQAGDRLPSDLSDGEWERLAQLISVAKPGGRPRKTDIRSAMNAIFDLLRTGCLWRYLPGGIFPPRSTVYNIFRAFQREGVWERIWEELRAALRERLGREASSSAGVIDSCSLKSAEKGDARKAKQTQWVTTPQEGEGAQDLRSARHRGLALACGGSLRRYPGSGWRRLGLRSHPPALQLVELIWADGGYNARQVERVVAAQPPLRVEIVKRPDGSSRLIVLPRRWVVERTFSWFGRNRRLAKDYENLADTLAALSKSASNCLRRCEDIDF